jgi:hypothetical protein
MRKPAVLVGPFQGTNLDGVNWRLDVPLYCEFPDGFKAMVPAGTITDFASSRLLSGIINFLPTRVADGVAPVFHDFWWRAQVLGFFDSNRRFRWLIAKTSCHRRDAVWAWVAWIGVTVGGWPTYLSYRKTHGRKKPTFQGCKKQDS